MMAHWQVMSHVAETLAPGGSVYNNDCIQHWQRPDWPVSGESIAITISLSQAV